ncbi:MULTISPECIES: peptidyl-prolyl cis-trans isomerase [Bacillaceae]|uniref:peptidyl-prolyl cis-trans isomerase n=1 Tax=Bacillaceae TaxID=186817 RepID=UPI002FFF901D
MENIIMIRGKVTFQITLDPGTWIFDDRKLDLTTYFTEEKKSANELEEYTKAVSKHWDREIMEGAIFPPTLKTEKKFEKVKLLTGTFGMPLKPFLHNAQPNADATVLVIHTKSGDTEMPLTQGIEVICGFSLNGKPLNEDGPVHAYFGDGSNKDNPIKNVIGFSLK